MLIPTTPIVRYVDGEFKVLTQEELEDFNSRMKALREENWEKIEAKKERARSHTVERTCGNCGAIKYRGINEATMKSGNCQRYSKSRIDLVLPTDAACPFWSLRSKAKTMSEQMNAEKLRKTLSEIRTRSR